ncbi:MAG: hypothetical protein NT069_04280 [Planctomycetota bacterium]|nr:hypothetical protein [Planctomycetota bacterium]
MTCDDAFELLTGSHTDRPEELQTHLHSCPRCCQMREVLAPAVALFDPAAGDGQESPRREDHTVTHARSNSAWTDVARVEAAIRESHQVQSTAGRFRFAPPGLSQIARGAALVLLGAVTAIGWMDSRHTPPAANGVAGVPEICNRALAAKLAGAGGATPQALQLAASCIACHHDDRIDTTR